MVYEYYRLTKSFKLGSKYDRWRNVAKVLALSKPACQRLEWIIFYQTRACRNASLTCRHFAIPPKTFYKWLKRFDEANLRTLENQSRAPKHRRQKEYTPNQYLKIVGLRKEHIRYGKFKLLVLYRQGYPDDQTISAWKVQSIIQDAKIYYHPKKQQRINKKRQLSQKKKRITDLKQKKLTGFCSVSIQSCYTGKVKNATS